MKIKAILAAIATTLAPLAASADEYIDETFEFRILPSLFAQGYSIQGDAVTRVLREGQSQTFTIYPPSGAEVIVAAVGDWDTNDVDIFIHGGNSGRLIVKDVATDDTPVCSFISRGGSYEITVKIVDTDAPAYARVVYAIR